MLRQMAASRTGRQASLAKPPHLQVDYLGRRSASAPRRNKPDMTHLLCLGPTMLDHTFPRDECELRRVAVALGEVQKLLETGDLRLVSTEPLTDIVEMFDWDYPQADICRLYPVLQSIYDLLNQWFLRQGTWLVTLYPPHRKDCAPHPVPLGVQPAGLVEDWSQELGRLRDIHSECTGDGESFIGITVTIALLLGRSRNV